MSQWLPCSNNATRLDAVVTEAVDELTKINKEERYLDWDPSSYPVLKTMKQVGEDPKHKTNLDSARCILSDLDCRTLTCTPPSGTPPLTSMRTTRSGTRVRSANSSQTRSRPRRGKLLTKEEHSFKFPSGISLKYT